VYTSRILKSQQLEEPDYVICVSRMQRHSWHSDRRSTLGLTYLQYRYIRYILVEVDIGPAVQLTVAWPRPRSWRWKNQTTSFAFLECNDTLGTPIGGPHWGWYRSFTSGYWPSVTRNWVHWYANWNPPCYRYVLYKTKWINLNSWKNQTTSFAFLECNDTLGTPIGGPHWGWYRKWRSLVLPTVEISIFYMNDTTYIPTI
jgi:hypothetical protein